jgi:hypothetical protein
LLVGGVVVSGVWSVAPGVVLLLEVLLELLPLSVVQLQASFICCCVEPSCLASCAAMHSFCVIWLLPVVSAVEEAEVAGGSAANASPPASAAAAAIIVDFTCFIEPPVNDNEVALDTYGSWPPIGGQLDLVKEKD